MTAYDVRISDWSSDVCSSDLPHLGRALEQAGDAARNPGIGVDNVEPAERVARQRHGARDIVFIARVDAARARGAAGLRDHPGGLVRAPALVGAAHLPALARKRVG